MEAQAYEMRCRCPINSYQTMHKPDTRECTSNDFADSAKQARTVASTSHVSCKWHAINDCQANVPWIMNGLELSSQASDSKTQCKWTDSSACAWHIPRVVCDHSKLIQRIINSRLGDAPKPPWPRLGTKRRSQACMHTCLSICIGKLYRH